MAIPIQKVRSNDLAFVSGHRSERWTLGIRSIACGINGWIRGLQKFVNLYARFPVPSDVGAFEIRNDVSGWFPRGTWRLRRAAWVDRRSRTCGNSTSDGHRVVSVFRGCLGCINETMVTTMINLNATITCPHCNVGTTETMPTDRCQFFYECPNGHTALKPKPGDCCVYCSYADRPCPSVQRSNTFISAEQSGT